MKMSWYNESLFDNTTYFWDYAVASNSVSSDMLFLLFFLLAPMFLVLVIVRSSGGSNALALLSGSGALTFVSLIMFSLGVVSQFIPILCTVLFGVSIVLFRLSD